jgi:L-iditol 2-dehydrogenase
MKAFALTAPHEFGPAEIPDEPAPGPGEVVVHPTACGVCASDVHYWQHGHIGDQVITEYPYAVGHECAGVVVEIGDGVTRVKPGDRVAIEPGITCEKCRPCREGRVNICPNVRFLGTPMIHGAMRDTLLTVEQNLETLPDGVSDEDAALCEPFGVGIHAVRLVGLVEGESVAIFGAGPIGLSTAVAARCAGAGRVVLAEPVPERRSLAAEMGFDVIDIDTDPVAKLHDLTGGDGPDVAFEAAGDLRAMSWTMFAPRLGGRSCVIGIPAEDEVPLEIHKLRRKELTIYNCRRSNRVLAEAVRLLAGPGAAIKKMCTHRFPLAETARAFEVSSERQDGVVKAMLMLDE